MSMEKGIYGVLVLSFFLLTALVYVDNPKNNQRAFMTLRPQSMEGLALWRQYNCQSCHQLYGYGGFLGPDLSNVTSRLPVERILAVLEKGSNRMPAFGFSWEDQNALLHFLEDLDSSGRGTPQHPRAQVLQWDSLVEKHLEGVRRSPDAVLLGAQHFRHRACGQCHKAFKAGLLDAPDLSLSLLDTEQILTILEHGKGKMPPFALKDAMAQETAAFINYLVEHRSELMALGGQANESEGSSIPWFAYPEIGNQ